MVVSVLNYSYYPVLGRLLDPTHFGETQTIISFFTQVGAFFQVLGLISVGIIAKYTDKNQREAITNEISRLALFVSIGFFILSVLLSPLGKNFFHFESIGPFILLGLTLLVSVPAAFSSAYLQGHKKFRQLVQVNISAAALKLCLAVVLVLAGFKTMGAIGGLVVSQILALILSLNRGQGLRNFARANLHLGKPQLGLLRPELKFALVVMCTSVTTNIFLSFDILVVKHYFPPALAGLYTGISIISNIIYYITAPFASVMIPSIKPNQSGSENRRILGRSLKITASIGGLALAVFVLAPHLVVLILLGNKYAVFASFLRGLALSMFVLAISVLLIYYHLGSRHLLVAPGVLLATIATIILLGLHHATMGMVVIDLVIGSLVLLAMLIGLLAVYHRAEVAKTGLSLSKA